MSREYPASLTPLIVEGRAKCKNGRVLIKAVTSFETDALVAKVARVRGVPVEEVAKEMGVDLSAANQNAMIRQAPYHEVVAVADDVEDPDIRPGALVYVVSAAMDFADTQEYTFVKASHIIACEAA